MSWLTNVLYWISTGLLIPVMIGLVLAFAWSLMMMGGFLGSLMQRLGFGRAVRRVVPGTVSDSGDQPDWHGEDWLKPLQGHRSFYHALTQARQWQWEAMHADKILADFELAGEKELESAKALMRIGPMLGLMGTLIPMGPALVGLAAGDIGSMAMNMQVAFSTTVVGIFCGGIGFIVQMVRKRWFVEDLHWLQYFFDLAAHAQSKSQRTVSTEVSS